MLKSTEARQYEEKLIELLKPYSCFKNHFAPDDLLGIKFKICSPDVINKKGNKSKRFPDWDNTVKFTQDIIFQELLPLCDDSQIILGSVSINFDTREFFEVEIFKVDGFGVCD